MAEMLRERLMRTAAYAPDGVDGGGSGAPEAAPARATIETVKLDTPVDAGTGAAPATARPEWVPEQFWRDAGADYEGLGKAYGELRTAFSGKEDKLREKVLAELRRDAPAKPEDYAFEIAADALPEGFELVPPGADDPMMAAARTVMHELGASPGQWQKLTAAFVGWQVAQQPNLAAEKAALGEGGEGRLAAVDAWLGRNLPEKDYQALVGSMRTAPAILAIERVMKLSIDRGLGGAPGGSQPAMSSEQLALTMGHPDYYHEQKGAEMRQKAKAAISAGVLPPGMSLPRR